MRMKSCSRGFSLIELLVSITVLGILTAIAIPAYVGQQKRAKMSEAKTNIQALSLLLEEFNADNGAYCPAAACVGQTYTYREAPDGTIITDSIREDPPGTDYLAAFKPRAASAGNSVLYRYDIQFDGGDPRLYTITATPEMGTPGAPNHPPMTMDQDGVKGPAGVW